MRILLIQDEVEVREKVMFAIESVFGAQVDEAGTPEAALEILKQKEPPCQLIIWDYTPTKTGEFESFRGKTINIPCLLSVLMKTKDASLPPGNVVGLVDRTKLIDEIALRIEALIKKGTLEGKKIKYARIRTKLLLAVAPLKGDIYIRLSEMKFLKLFKQGDVFDRDDLEKYTVKKGIEFLYIKEEQTSEFIQKYKTDLEQMLSKNLSIEEVAKSAESVHETIRELSKTIGFTPEVQEIAKTQIAATMKAIGKAPKLSDILSKIRASEGQYIGAHSTLCAYLACAISSQLKWASEQTFHKLNLAAMLHDVTLTNHKLAACTSIEEATAGGFTDAEITAFKAHPFEGAQIAKSFTEVPPDVDAIIIQHHERPDGTGFPRRLNHQYIAPLSAIFIVAHDLTQYALKTGDRFSVPEFVKTYRSLYKTSQFRKILQCLEELQDSVKLPTKAA